jgi:hypothetical protein
MKYLKWPLVALRWVWSYVLRFWYWLEETNYDFPPMSLRNFLYVAAANLGLGIVIGYALFHSPMKIPAADKFVSALPVEPALPAIFPKQLNPGPLPVAATPLPCVPTPAVKVLNPAKKVARKAKRAKNPAAESTFWSF